MYSVGMYAPIELRQDHESGTVTYERLLEYGKQRFSQIYGGDTRTNIASSHLHTFVEALGKSLADVVGDDLGDQFEHCLAVRLKDAKENYKSQIKHYLKRWCQLNSELVKNAHLPVNFSDVLQLVMGERGLRDDDVAKFLNIKARRIMAWRLGENVPKGKVCIQQLVGHPSCR